MSFTLPLNLLKKPLVVSAMITNQAHIQKSTPSP